APAAHVESLLWQPQPRRRRPPKMPGGTPRQRFGATSCVWRSSSQAFASGAPCRSEGPSLYLKCTRTTAITCIPAHNKCLADCGDGAHRKATPSLSDNVKRPPWYRAAFLVRRLAILRGVRRVDAGGRCGKDT